MTHIITTLIASHFLLKLVLTPIIISIATLVSRRWGETVGGLLIGLPLTSAPVSFFFAIEQGRQFAEKAAFSAMLGLIPVATFCVCYALAARRLSWLGAAAAGIGAYLVAVLGVSRIEPGFISVVLLVPLALSAGMLILGRPDAETTRVVSPWWDIPLRMVLATTILILITTGASTLGPLWSGLLSPFPIFTFVMAFFSHSQGGFGAAGRLIRGVVRGLFGYLVFFLVTSLLITRTSLGLVYGAATLAALLVNGFSLLRQVHPLRSFQGAK